MHAGEHSCTRPLTVNLYPEQTAIIVLQRMIVSAPENVRR
jgi:hypothetical protein